MYLCYIDESGTPEITGNTSHYVLAGLSIPIWHWKECDKEIESIKNKYRLANKEIHVAWMMRPYLEQSKIPDFSKLNYAERISQIESLRKAELLRLLRVSKSGLHKQTKKNYQKTQDYIHLNFDERRNLIREILTCVSKWGFARLFAECIDKVFFDPKKSTQTISEQSFEQIVSRFEHYLQITSKNEPQKLFGLLIHDNNETVAKKHTELMRDFHLRGTLWTKIHNIIETPLFIDSQLTSMVQITDICSYALRRYLENNEDELFNLAFQRADRKDGAVVGIRHFTKTGCTCKICAVHKKQS